MDDDVVFFAMVQRYNIYFKYVSLRHDILGSHGAKSSTENIYWAKYYREMAIKMLAQLSTDRYLSQDKNSSFLLHSTGHHPAGSEIDTSIIYADYYYIEGIEKLKD